MPTTRRSGLAIHFEVGGSGPPLVLLHGGFASSETWRMEGYVAGLRDDYRLVLVDARGHGQSEAPNKPHEPVAYGNSLLAADVLAVLDEVGLASAALCGFSMGACTALRVAACYPRRVDAVAAIGAGLKSVGFADVPPWEDGDDPLAQRIDREGMAGMVADLEREGRPEWARLIGRADPRAMAALLRGPLEPIQQRLKDLAMPCLFVWGEQEVHEGDEALLPAQARFVVVPGADHVGAFQRSDLLLPEIRSLLAQVRSAPVTTAEAQREHPEVRRVPTAALTAPEVAGIRQLVWAAFAPTEPTDVGFSEEDWEHALGGLHFLLERDGAIVAHAAVVERVLHVADRPLRTGYVEAVATLPQRQGEGLGSRVMEDVAAYILANFELGALETGRHAFYERLGWRTWRGPSSVRTTDGTQATPEDDGYILVLPTPASPPLDLTAPINCDWRPGHLW